MKYIMPVVVCIVAYLLASCENGTDNQSDTATEEATSEQTAQTKDYSKGIGEVENVVLTDPLDEDMIEKGKAIYEMKCSACHKLTDQRVVGPGWAGITNKRKPEWIMNMITNVEVMLAEDPTAQKLLEECLTRMPNQGLSIGDARDVLEYMRENDLEKVGQKDQAVK